MHTKKCRECKEQKHYSEYSTGKITCKSCMTKILSRETKKCRKCGADKKRNKFNPSKSNNDRLSSYCRDCKPPKKTTRSCSGCRKEQPLTYYTKTRRGTLSSLCKDCKPEKGTRPPNIDIYIPFEKKTSHAIQTHHNGYVFRSRLEARWAVFFETQGIKFDYEPEGFEFENGLRYLPDFYLPQVDMWAEVKPKMLTKTEWDKAHFLSIYTEKMCLLLDGVPDFRSYFALSDISEYSDYTDYYNPMSDNDRMAYFILTSSFLNDRYPCFYRCFECNEKGMLEFEPNFVKAIHAARAARFGVYD